MTTDKTRELVRLNERYKTDPIQIEDRAVDIDDAVSLANQDPIEVADDISIKLE